MLSAEVVDLIRSLVDMFKCVMESDLLNALFSAQILFTRLCSSFLTSKCSCEYARMYNLA